MAETIDIQLFRFPFRGHGRSNFHISLLKKVRLQKKANMEDEGDD